MRLTPVIQAQHPNAARQKLKKGKKLVVKTFFSYAFCLITPVNISRVFSQQNLNFPTDEL